MSNENISTNLNVAGEIIEAELGTPMFIWGPPGVGKSAKIKELADKNEMALIDVRLSQMDPSDIRGLPYFLNDMVNGRELKRAHWAIPSFFPSEEIHGKRGILLLDELSSAPPMVQASAYQLVLDRRVGDAVLPPGWSVLAAGNRVSDRSVVYKLAKALANRFVHIEIQPDIDVWKEWALQVGADGNTKIDPRIIGFVSWKGVTGLFDFRSDSDEPAFPSPRTWEYADRILKGKLNKTHIPIDKNVALHFALSGAIGFAAATTFINYIAITDKLPNIEAIVSGYTNVEVPEDVGLRYATISGIVSKLVQFYNRPEKALQFQGYLSNAIRYVDKFETEFATLFVTDIGKVKGVNIEIIKNEDFKLWRTRNLDMFRTTLPAEAAKA